jgi:organic radical activating enzyme
MIDNLIDWKKKNLDNVSCSFCAAKWYNASIHLGAGLTNSCHLPLPHPIDIKEILKNPSAIHNTAHKKEMRRMMLSGIRPAECSYCWKIEDIGRDNVSDRVYKSQIYSEKDIAVLKNTPWDADVLLKTLEISFDRTCNFACSYCNAAYSTTWAKDITSNGAYQNFKTPNGGFYQANGNWAEQYGKHNEENPYVQAFLEWWPELVTTLQEIRITGGEPSQSHNFWKFMELMKQYPSKRLRLAINSNLGMNDATLDRLIGITKELTVKEVDIYTSNEAFGKQAEYIRDGLQYDKWRSNLVKLIEKAEIRQVVVMMTINSLCLFSITDFLDDMIGLKKLYGNNMPVVDLNILRWPSFMSPLSLPDEIKTSLRNKLSIWFKSNKKYFNKNEAGQIERLIDYIEVVNRGHNSTNLEKETQYHDFKSFYTQYDIRRNKNFNETFPEISEWYNGIELSKDYKIVEASIGHPPGFEVGEYVSDVQNYNKPVIEVPKRKLI